MPTGLLDNSFVSRAGFSMLDLQLFDKVGVRFIEPDGHYGPAKGAGRMNATPTMLGGRVERCRD